MFTGIIFRLVDPADMSHTHKPASPGLTTIQSSDVTLSMVLENVPQHPMGQHRPVSPLRGPLAMVSWPQRACEGDLEANSASV